jgi:hypothetical protein
MLALEAGVAMQWYELKSIKLWFMWLDDPDVTYNWLMQVQRHCIAPRRYQCSADWHCGVTQPSQWQRVVHMASADHLLVCGVLEQQLASCSMLMQPQSAVPGLAVVGGMVLAAA